MIVDNHDVIVKGAKAADLISKEEEEKVIVDFLGKAIAIFVAWHFSTYFRKVFMEIFSPDDVS
jgi:translation initiation factor IF-3